MYVTIENCYRRYRTHCPYSRRKKFLSETNINTEELSEIIEKRHVTEQTPTEGAQRKLGNYMSASDETRKIEEGISSEAKSKVHKVESDGEDTDLEFYDKSDDKPVHFNIGKEITEKHLHF